MKIRKTGYYFRSVLALLQGLKNPTALFLVPFRRETVLYLKNGLQLQIRTLLDCLIIKETIMDDTYHVKQLSNPKLVIDIGGGLGEFALFVADQHPKATVLSFEPNLAFYSLLEANIERNRSKNIQAKPIGIAKKAQKKSLLLGSEFAKGSLFTRNDEPTQQTISVRVEPLQIFLHKPVDLLKIDCEGAEWDILTAVPKNAFHNLKSIALEYHRHARPHMDTDLSDFLTEHGYTVTLQPDPYDKQIGYLYATKSALV